MLVWQKSVLPKEARSQPGTSREIPDHPGRMNAHSLLKNQATSFVNRHSRCSHLIALMIISRQGIVRGVAGERSRSVRRGP